MNVSPRELAILDAARRYAKAVNAEYVTNALCKGSLEPEKQKRLVDAEYEVENAQMSLLSLAGEYL